VQQPPTPVARIWRARDETLLLQASRDVGHGGPIQGHRRRERALIRPRVLPDGYEHGELRTGQRGVDLARPARHVSLIQPASQVSRSRQQGLGRGQRRSDALSNQRPTVTLRHHRHPTFVASETPRCLCGRLPCGIRRSRSGLLTHLTNDAVGDQGRRPHPSTGRCPARQWASDSPSRSCRAERRHRRRQPARALLVSSAEFWTRQWRRTRSLQRKERTMMTVLTTIRLRPGGEDGWDLSDARTLRVSTAHAGLGLWSAPGPGGRPSFPGDRRHLEKRGTTGRRGMTIRRSSKSAPSCNDWRPHIT
jgi:hypothetical protein